MRSSILKPRSSTRLLHGALLVIPAIAPVQTKLRASFAVTTGYHLPMSVQKPEGLDKKYGIDMEILVVTRAGLEKQRPLSHRQPGQKRNGNDPLHRHELSR
jgi:ABC-type nitrate/sulfonate/bicarbonate transport system substrate-binding protein